MSEWGRGSPLANAIHIRDIKFDFDDIPRRWHSGKVGVTAFYDALSVLFPLGERAFIRSILRVRDDINDPELLKSIDGFKGQEAIHAREHEKYNQRLRSLGYEVDALEAKQAKTIDWTENKLGCYRNLAITACMEHFTSILASQVVGDLGYFEGANSKVRDFWTWHALEEIEHRTVAFDVLRAVRPGYLFRCSMMLLTSWIFMRQIMVRLNAVLKIEKKRLTIKTWSELVGYLYFRPGLVRRMALPYFAFFKPGFHPSQISVRGDLSPLQARYNERLQ